MSIHSRDYMRGEERRGSAPWSVVVWLIVINAVVYLLNNLIFYSPQRDIFALSLDALKSLRLWTPLTYQFVHANLWHLLGNMLGLFFLGRMLLDMVGPRLVVRIYLLGGLAGGGLQLVYNAIFGPDALIIGASASVLAIVIAVCTLVPYQRIQLLLFFVIPISLTLKQVALVIIATNVLTLLFRFSAPGGDGIAVMAHFGGILFGWAFIRLGFHESSPAPARTRERSSVKERFGIRIIRESDPEAGEKSPRKKEPFVTSDVDAILDKINELGFQSLTEEERLTLEKSSRKLSKRVDRDS